MKGNGVNKDDAWRARNIYEATYSSVVIYFEYKPVALRYIDIYVIIGIGMLYATSRPKNSSQRNNT
jgi:hypothetical protein